MGASFVNLGLTVESTLPVSDIAQAKQVIASHATELLAQIDWWDRSGLVELTDNQDENLTIVTDTLTEGMGWLLDPYQYATWRVPGTSRHFITSGGLSWGDNPFDEFDAVSMLAEACVVVPALGHALGVLGDGIRSVYEDELRV